MITVVDGVAEIRFPWPTNDVGGGVLKVMRQQANAALAAQPDLVVPGGMRYTNLARTETGWEFLFSGTVKVPPTTEEVPV